MVCKHYIPQKNENASLTPNEIGNRCGHVYDSPRVFKEPKHHKQRPYLLVEARKRLRRTYYNPAVYEAGMMAYHNAKQNLDGGKRKMRSEIREAVTHAVGEALAHYASIGAMAVGFTDNKGKFVSLGITSIAKKAGVSYQRARDAIAVFEAAGTVTVEQNTYLTKDGKFRKTEALIRINHKFFYNLGFDDVDIKNYKSKDKAKTDRILQEQKRSEFKANSDLYLKIKRGQRLSERELRLLDNNDKGWQRPYQPTQTKRPVIAEFKATGDNTAPRLTEVGKEALLAIRAKLNTS